MYLQSDGAPPRVSGTLLEPAVGPGRDGRALILGCPHRAWVSRRHKYLFPSGSFRHLNCSYCFVQTETLVKGGPQKVVFPGQELSCFGSVCVVTSAPRRPYMLHFALKMPEATPLVLHRPPSDAASAARTCVFCFSKRFGLFDWIPETRVSGEGRGRAWGCQHLQSRPAPCAVG